MAQLQATADADFTDEYAADELTVPLSFARSEPAAKVAADESELAEEAPLVFDDEYDTDELTARFSFNPSEPTSESASAEEAAPELFAVPKSDAIIEWDLLDAPAANEQMEVSPPSVPVPVEPQATKPLAAEPVTRAHQPMPEPVAAVEAPVLIEAEPDSDRAAPEVVQTHSAAPDYFQLALQVRGEELARIWAREGKALAGRTFVWSEQLQAWFLMRGTHATLQLPAPRQGAGPRSLVKPTREAVVSNLMRPSSWVFAGLGAAAALIITLGLSRGSAPPMNTAVLNDTVSSAATEPAAATRGTANDAKSSSSAKSIEELDIIPVTSLPLVSARNAHLLDRRQIKLPSDSSN